MVKGREPSFSSTLLDEIYRSIGEGNAEVGEFYSYKQPLKKKQQAPRVNREAEEPEMDSLFRARMTEKWMEKRVREKVLSRRNHPETEGKTHIDNDQSSFSSSSLSSDSSSNGFSSSETDSAHGRGTRTPSCFAPLKPKPKPVRTEAAARSVRTKEKAGKGERVERERPLSFYEENEIRFFDGSSKSSPPRGFIKSKSRALKIYSNLKNLKQPISPGGRLATFINSIFTHGQAKRSQNSSPSPSISIARGFEERGKAKTEQSSTCSSASSFSRSCLSKHSPSTREKLQNGTKRSVRFYPVSVIVDGDCRPCGHKSLCEEEEETKLGTRRCSRKSVEELKIKIIEKNRRAEDSATGIMMKCHQKRELNASNFMEDDEEEEDDDTSSCSSSDLFELDHLSFLGKDRYSQELPVYETTHVGTNRAIASGLIL